MIIQSVKGLRLSTTQKEDNDISSSGTSSPGKCSTKTSLMKNRKKVMWLMVNTDFHLHYSNHIMRSKAKKQ